MKTGLILRKEKKMQVVYLLVGKHDRMKTGLILIASRRIGKTLIGWKA